MRCKKVYMKIANILFTYNRPVHTQRVLEGLKNNTVKPQKLYIFHDGMKENTNKNDWDKVENVIRSVDWCECEIITSNINKGLANSVIDGINYVFESNDAIIVLEDDCMPAISFMTFMTQALEFYRNYDRVYSVSGYGWPFKIDSDGYDAYFNGRISSWGWGTWKNRWKEYERDDFIIERLRERKEDSINLATWGNDLELMHRDTKQKRVNSWAVYWALKVIEKNGFCVSPIESLISNIGCDGSGIHCESTEKYDVMLSEKSKENFDFPTQYEFRQDVKEKFIALVGCPMLLENGLGKERIMIYGVGGHYKSIEAKIFDRYHVVIYFDKNKTGYYAGVPMINDVNRIEEFVFDKIVITILDQEEQKKIKKMLNREGRIIVTSEEM